MHDACAAAGVPVWHGGMLESGIGRAHNIHLSTLPNFTLPGDIAASRRYYAEDLIEPGHRGFARRHRRRARRARHRRHARARSPLPRHPAPRQPDTAVTRTCHRLTRARPRRARLRRARPRRRRHPCRPRGNRSSRGSCASKISACCARPAPVAAVAPRPGRAYLPVVPDLILMLQDPERPRPPARGPRGRAGRAPRGRRAAGAAVRRSRPRGAPDGGLRARHPRQRTAVPPLAGGAGRQLAARAGTRGRGARAARRARPGRSDRVDGRGARCCGRAARPDGGRSDLPAAARDRGRAARDLRAHPPEVVRRPGSRRARCVRAAPDALVAGRLRVPARRRSSAPRRR